MYIQASEYAAIICDNIKKDEYFKDFKVMPYRFIVVNRKTLNPLVWEWKYTFCDTTVEIENSRGIPVRLRNFKTIGKELSHYMKDQSIVPDGIVLDGTNDISDWIKKM